MTEKKQSSENQTKKESPRQVSGHLNDVKSKKKKREKRRLFNTLRYQVGVPPTLALILPSLANASDDTGDEGNIAESHALTQKATVPHENTQAPDSETPTSPSSEHQELVANSDDTESGHTHALPSRHLALHHYPMHAYTSHHIVNQSGTASSARDNHVDGIAPFSVSAEKTQQTDEVHKSPFFNSAPKMSQQSHAVKEDDAIFHGKMGATDADGDTLSYVISKPINGLTFHSDGSYTFDPSHGSYQHLAQGTTEVVSTTVIVTDNMGGTHSEQLQFIVTGTNDTPKVTGQFTGALKEDLNVDGSGLMHVHGKVDVVDVDQAESHTLSEVVQGKFGVLDIDSNGHWHYQVDNSLPAIQQLASGSTITEQITIHTADQTPQLIEIVIGGTADSAVISGVDSGSVKEDLNVVNGSVKTSGDLSIIDSDQGQSHFLSQVLVGRFGTLTIEANGDWQFEANNQQTALQELAKGAHLNETFTVSSADGTAHNIDIQIDGTNDLPVMAGQSQSVKEDGAVFHGQMVATDVDHDLLTYTTSNPIDGLTFNPDGSYTFDPSHTSYQHLSKGDTQVVTTMVTVTDTAGGSHREQLKFTITGTNDLPVMAGQSQSVKEDGAVFHGQMVATDVDHDLLTYTTSNPIDGLTFNPDGSYTFDPSHASYQHLSKGDTQVVTTMVTVTDTAGGSHRELLKFTITGTNDLPVMAGQSQSVKEDGAVFHGQMVATDVDHDLLTYTTSNPIDGLTFNPDGSYTFDPSHASYQHLSKGDTQVVTTMVTVTDTAGGSHREQLKFTITGTNDLPVMAGQSQSVKEDGAVFHGQMVATDVDHDLLTYTTSNPTDGLTFNPDGSYTFDPSHASYQHLSKGDTQVVTTMVTVTDTAGGSHREQLKFTITGTNDLPVMAGQSQSVKEDGAVFHGQMVATDVDHDLLTYTTSNPIDGLTFNPDGSYTFDPSHASYQHLSKGDTQIVTTMVTVTDTAGGSHREQLKFTITGTNDLPVMAGQSQSVKEDGAVFHGQMVATDVDHDLLTYTTSNPIDGLTFNPDGSYTFDPSHASYQHLSKGDTQVVTTMVTVTDTAGGAHREQLKFTITGTNDLPVMAGQSQSVKEDGAVFHGQMVATDVDHDLLTYTTSNPIDGLKFNPDGSYTFDPSHASYQHLSKDDTQVVTTMVTVTDTAGGSHRELLKFTITGTNDLPVMAGQSQSVKEDGAVFHGQMVATDVDHDLLTYTTSNPIDGLTFNPDGSYTFDPSHASYQHLAVGDTQTVKTTVIVTDTAGGKDQKELSFVIEGTNDKPTVTPITAQFHEDQSQHLDINLLSHAQDVDGDVLNVGSLFQVKVNGHTERLPDGFGIVNGHLQVDPSSSTFQHLAQGEVATFELSYKVTDSHGASTPQSVTVKIVGTDDKAQLVSSSINIGESAAEHTYHGTSIKGALQLTDIDTHDNPQFVDMIYQSSSRLGALALHADGHYEYFLQGNYVGTANAQKTVAALKPGESITETFSVKTADGQTKPVTVTIHGEEDSAQIVVNYGATDNHLHEDSMTSPAYPTELFATGIVKAIDPDHDDDQLKPQTLVSTRGGHFTVTETGMWQYHIDNSLPAIQQLGKGDSFQEQFTVESKDGSAQKVITVTVHGTNDDPEVSSTVTLPPGHEDQPYIISGAALLANATDVDANDAGHLSVASLVALKADGSSAGVITDNHNGSFTFTPELNYNGPVRFSYEVHDGHGGSVVTSASASLKPVSDNAQISYASTDHHLAGVTEDRGYIDTHDKLHFEGKLDIVDPDQGEAMFDINYGSQTYTGIGYDTKLGGHILLMRDGHYTYTIRDHQPQVQKLSQGEVLTDQCVVRAKDGTTFTIEVNIHGTNDAPTLSAQTQAVTEDGNSLNGQMQGRDIDHGATLTYSIAHAIDGLTLNTDGSYTFDPSHASYQQLKDGEHKVIDIPVTVTDEHGASSTQNLTINVKGTGDAAVIGGVDTGDVHENQAGQDKSPDYAQPGIGIIGQDSLKTSGQLTIVDPDSGEAVFDPNGQVYSYSGQYGHLLLRPDGHWEYAVAAGTHDWHLGSTKTTVGSTIDQLGQGETLTDTVTVHSKDGTTHDIVITIHGDNDAPYVSSEVTLQSGKEDVSQTFTKADLLANAVDVDSNDAGLMTVSNLLADHGSIRDNHDGTYTYTPELNYHGKVHFIYDINDAHGGSTPTGASLDFASANDASVLAAGQDSGTVTEDHLRSGTAGQLWSGWTNLDVTDVDSAFEAEVAFIEVNGIKHAVPADFGMSLTANHGYFSTTHSTDGHNKWSYTADNTSPEIQGLKTGQQLQDTMVLITKDGTRIPVTATIQGQDDHVIIDTPDALTAAIGTAVEDIKTTVVGVLQAHDLDKGDQVSFELAGAASSQAGSYGTFYVDRAGHWHYDLDASKVDSLRSGDGKAEAFNIVAISSDGSRATQKVEILVQGTDDTAIITGQSTGSVTEDLHVQGDARHTVFTGGVLNVIDPDIGQRGFHQTLNAHAISDPYGGSLSIDKAGGWIYSVPNGNLQHLAQGETQHVQYQVQTLGGDIHVITVDIVGTNDKPTLTAQTQTVNEGGSLLNGQMQASDIDHGATLAYSISKPVDGLTFNADGSYTFDPTNASYDHLAKGQTQTLTIPVTVTDEHGASATKDLNITVTGTNDAAQITGADSGDVYESTYADRSPDYQRGIISHLWNDSIHTSGKLDIADHDFGEAHFDNNAPTYQYFGQYGRLILQPDGDWYYSVDVGNSAVGRKIDALNTGENLTDTITVRSADGTTHDVVITIHGDNDSPFASGEVQLNSGKEDLVQTITVSELLANTVDVDTNDIGKLTITNLYADHGSVLDNHDGTYTFTPDADYNGQVHFTYDVQDTHGGVTHTGATTNLAAVNDAATLASPGTGSVTEDHTRAANSSELWTGWLNLDIQDSDSAAEAKVIQIQVNGVTHTVPSDFAMDLTSSHGTFHFTQSTDGHVKWAYTADNSQSEIQGLSHGESLTDTITLVTADGTKLPLTANIQGTDDQVIIDTPNAQTAPLGSVTEDVKNSVSGMLLAHDADSKDSVTFAAGDSAGKYGSLHVDADGHWHYDLDPAKANVLGQGQRFVEGFNITATSTDGSTSTQRVEVWVDGTDDHTIISGVNHGIATEDVRTPMSTNVSLLDAVDWQALQITDVDSPNTQVTVEFSGHQYTWDLGADLDVTTPYGKFQFHTITSGPHQGEHSWNYIGDNKNSDVQGLKAGESIQETIKLIAKDGTEFPIHVEVKGTEDGVVIDSTSELGHVTENAQTGASVSGQLNAHDTDIHDQVHWTATPSSGVSGSYGTFHVDKAGQWHYDVDQSKATQLGAGDEKWEYFTVEAVSSDGSQVTKRVAVVVHGHNDNPTVSSDVTLSAGKEDQAIQLTQADLLAHAANVDRNDLGWLRVANLTSDHGKITTNSDGSFTFTPEQDYNGQVHFTYNVVERHGGSTPAHASLSLQAVNDLPVIHGDSSGAVTEQGIDAHGAAIGAEVAQGVLTTTDPDVGDTITWSVSSQTGLYGTLTVNQHGEWRYQLNDANPLVQEMTSGSTVHDSFTVTATDSSGVAVQQVVTVVVQGSNDGATIDGQVTSSLNYNLTEDAAVSTLTGHLQLTDVDSSEDEFVPLHQSAGTYGHLSLDANGDWTYTLDNQLAATNALQTGQVVTEHFTVQSPDGTASKTITVNVHGHDDLPTLTVNEGDGTQNLDLFAGLQAHQVRQVQYSTDGVNYTSTPPAGFTLAPDGHTLQVDVSGSSYDHLATGVKQSIYINYELQEGTGSSAHISQQHGLVEVIGTSDAPVLHSFSPRADQFSGPITGNLLQGASDVDDGAHLVLQDIQYREGAGYHVLHPGESHTIANVGTLSIQANGDYTFTPDPTFTGTVPAMWYRVVDTTDSHNVQKQSTLHISIDANHQPTVAALSASFNEDTDLAMSVSDFGYADRDSDALHSITITQVPDASHGHLILDGHVLTDGTAVLAVDVDRLIFRPVANYNGSATFNYSANDGHSDSTVQHAQLTVASVNDAPVIHLTPITPVIGTITQTDVDAGDTHTFGVTLPTGSFGTLTVDPDTGAYKYVPNGQIIGMQYNQGTGHYSGQDTFEISVTDTAGATSSIFVTFDVEGTVTASTVAGQAPSVTTHVTSQPTTSQNTPSGMVSAQQTVNHVTIDLAATSDSGSSNSDNLTNDQTPTLSGHTDIPFSQVKLYDGAHVVGSGYSDAHGHYQIDVSSLTNGVHNLCARALAPASFLPAVSSLLPVTIDTSLPVPTISVDRVTQDNVINATESNATIAITGACSGEIHQGDVVVVELSGHQYRGQIDSTGHYSIDVPGAELEKSATFKVTVTTSDSAGNVATASMDHHYLVDTSVDSPTITFESPGADNLYSKTEIAHGAAGTITATVHAAADAKVGEHLNINGVDHLLDAQAIQRGINVEVAPNSVVKAVMTDEHGNANSALNIASGAKPEPIVVTAPSGSHHISASLGVPTLIPTANPVPVTQQGWKILVNGHYHTSFTSQWGTLTIDPKTGDLSYQEHGATHTGPHGSAQIAGVHEDHFEIALQGSHQDDVTLHVKVNILSYGPGNSGKLTLGSEVLDMTVTPILSHAQPAPPPPSSDAFDTPSSDIIHDSHSELTIMVELGIDTNTGEADPHSQHSTVSSYMEQLGIAQPSFVDAKEHNTGLPDDIDIVLNDTEHHDVAGEQQGDIPLHDEQSGIEHLQDADSDHRDLDDPTLADDPTK